MTEINNLESQSAPVQPLAFTRFDVSQSSSLSFVMAGREDVTGIYVLEFENGERYVGQAVDVRARFLTHRRRFTDLLAIEFAPCARDQLDSLERNVIAHYEASGVRNKLLTNLPGGLGDVELTVEEGTDVVLPWDRAKRASVGDGASRSRRKFWELVSRDSYPELRHALARYVDQTIPDPLAAEKYLWTITALPATRRTRRDHRLVTINCGGVETFYVRQLTDDEGHIDHLSILHAREDRLPTELLESARREHGVTIARGTYRRAKDSVLLLVSGWQSLGWLLDQEDVLDAAYALNVQLMRQGPSVYSRYHNSALAMDVLDTIVTPSRV